MVLNNEWVDMIGSVDLFCSDIDSVSGSDIQGFDDPITVINNDFNNCCNCLKIGQLNVRSLPAHYDEIKQILLNTDFDIMAITETWLNNNISNNMVKIPGYKMYRRDRTLKTGGGICIYVKEYLSSKLINVVYDNNLIELMFVEVILKHCKIAVGVLYRPPNVSYTMYSKLLPLINGIMHNFANIILTGDFNVNMLVDGCDNKYLTENLLNPCSLYQVINQPTRITQTSTALLDLILVNNERNVKLSGAVDVPGIGDHHLTYIAYATKKPKFVPKVIFKRNFKHVNKNNFVEDAEAAHWENVLL